MSLLNEQFRICPLFKSAANRIVETLETERMGRHHDYSSFRYSFNGSTDEISTRIVVTPRTKDRCFRKYCIYTPRKRIHVFTGCRNKDCKIDRNLQAGCVK